MKYAHATPEAPKEPTRGSLRQFVVFYKKNWFRAVPCGPHIDVSFKFGGFEVLIRPLDDPIVGEFGRKGAGGKAACVGSASLSVLL